MKLAKLMKNREPPNITQKQCQNAQQHWQTDPFFGRRLKPISHEISELQ